VKISEAGVTSGGDGSGGISQGPKPWANPDWIPRAKKNPVQSLRKQDAELRAREGEGGYGDLRSFCLRKRERTGGSKRNGSEKKKFLSLYIRAQNADAIEDLLNVRGGKRQFPS